MSTIKELEVRLEKEKQKLEIWKMIQATSLNDFLNSIIELACEEESSWRNEKNKHLQKNFIAENWRTFRRDLQDIVEDELECEISLELTTEGKEGTHA